MKAARGHEGWNEIKAVKEKNIAETQSKISRFNPAALDRCLAECPSRSR
jgi:hypothetical protein